MKHFYITLHYLFFALCFLQCLFSGRSYGQTLVIDDTAPRITSVASNGQDLTATTYNYVRIPDLLSIDSLKTDGTFYRHLFMVWGTGIETASPPPGTLPGSQNAWSSNFGATWNLASYDVRFGSGMKLKSGKILSIDFRPTYVDYNDFPLNYFTSVNNGSTWTTHTDGMIKFPPPLQVYGLRMHKSLIEEPDGTLYTCAYVRYTFSTTFRTYILKSLDGGKTWLPMLNGSGNPIEIDGIEATDEGSLVRCPDGSWLVVMKQVSTDPDITYPLLYSRSTDKGATWTVPAQLPGLGISASGKNPHVILMANGVLALSWGTPDIEMSFSANSGGFWTVPIKTFPNPGGTKVPSGNTCLIPIGQNKLLQFGDNYSKTINPNTQAIWQKEIEIVRPEQNRIDLRTKNTLGLVTIMPQTTLMYTSGTHQEARPTGAFDGSTDYWSAAMGTNSGIYQLDLQKTYQLQTIGVSLLYNTPESATVELSPDNINWTTVKTYTNATHYCVDYTGITPFNARYVRVTVSGTGQIGLGELELYEASSTFEGNASAASSNPHGILAEGYVANGTSATQYGFSVQEGMGYQSNRALKLWDGSSTWRAGIKKITTASNKKTLEFRCRIAALPTGTAFNIPIIGTVSGASTTVFWVAAFASTSTTSVVKYYNGTSWLPIGTATLPISATVWKLVKITADEAANTASLYIDNVLMGSFPMSANTVNATNLTGFALNSNGTATSGEIVYFDDINFYDPTVSGGSGIASVAGQENILISNLTGEVTKVNNQVANELIVESFSISVSPNPANDLAKVAFKNSLKGIINVYVTDMMGWPVKRLKYNSAGDLSFLDIPIQDLSPGVYVITANQNNRIAKTKLIVKK
jgi:hypothetical protein